MENGKLYFIKDEYLEKWNLLQNKGSNHDRPFYCSFHDKFNPEISWVVPLSSKVEHYEELYDRYMQRFHKCDVIDFTYVLNRKSAVAIKNAFPVTDEYIKNCYKNPYTKKDIMIKYEDRYRITGKLRALLGLQMKGHNIFFHDVMEMKKDLIRSITQTQEHGKKVETLYQSPFEAETAEIEVDGLEDIDEVPVIGIR